MQCLRKDGDLKALLHIPVPSRTIRGRTLPLLEALEGIQAQESTHTRVEELENLMRVDGEGACSMFHTPMVPLRISDTPEKLSDVPVYQMVADEVNNKLFVLMENGKLEVWDGFSNKVRVHYS
jgi:hypothetical protein